MPKTDKRPSQYRDETALTLIFIKTITENFILSVLRGEVKSLSSSTSHEVVQCYPSNPFSGVVAWFKDYVNGVYNLLRVTVTEHCQESSLSLSSTIVKEESSSEYPTALTFILDAEGVATLAMLDALQPSSPCFLMMTKQWWEELFLSFPSVTPLGKSEDWESTRKSYVVEVVRAISSRSDINEGFIALVIKMAHTADARHQVSWTMKQLHWRHEEVRVVNAVPTSTQSDDPVVMTGQGQLATVPRNVTALKSTVSRKEPQAPTDVTQNYVPQENSLELCKNPALNDIIEGSTLQCPPPPSERNSLSESTGSSERPSSRKGGVDKEDLCEDVDKLPSQCTEENPQKDQLLKNEDSQITYLQYFIETPRTALRETSGSLVTKVDVAEESQSGDDLQCPTQCSEPNPENDQEVRNEDEDVPRAGAGPFVPADGVVEVSSLSTEEKPKKDLLV